MVCKNNIVSFLINHEILISALIKTLRNQRFFQFALIKSGVNLSRINLALALISDNKIDTLWQGTRKKMNAKIDKKEGIARQEEDVK